MSEDATRFEYTGTDNLEAMLEAVSYNRFLVDCIGTYGVGRGRTLDFGAGLGTFSQMVRETGREVECLEPDRALATILAAKGFKTVRASCEVADGSYDYIYSLNVFEHIENDRAAARETYRMLRPGGTIFVYVPAFQVLFGSMDRKVEHFRRYTRSNLTELFAAVGFSVQKAQYVDALGFVATVVYNVVSKGDGSIDKRSVRVYDRYVFPLSRGIDRLTSRFVGKNVLLVAQK